MTHLCKDSGKNKVLTFLKWMNYKKTKIFFGIKPLRFLYEKYLCLIFYPASYCKMFHFKNSHIMKNSNELTKTTIAKEELQFENVLLSEIRFSPTNPRKFIDEVAVLELAQSIIEVGVLQNITVRPVEKDDAGTIYELVAGERRVRASRIAEQLTIIACIRDLNDDEVLEIQVTENLQRKDVTPLEEAYSFENWLTIRTRKITVKDIATRIGKSEVYVYQRLTLINLIDYAKDLLSSGVLPCTHALEIAKLSADFQKRILDKIVTKSYYGEDKDQITAVSTLAKTKAYIRDMFELDLSTASFSIKDKNLCPAAGACTSCTKRTGNNTTLFNDIEKGDFCMDENCFDEKSKTNLLNKIESASSNGKSIILVTNSYNGMHETKELGREVIGFNSYKLKTSIMETYPDFNGKGIFKKAMYVDGILQSKTVEILLNADKEVFENAIVAQGLDDSEENYSDDEDDDDEDNSKITLTWSEKNDISNGVMKGIISLHKNLQLSNEIVQKILIKKIEDSLRNLGSTFLELIVDQFGYKEEFTLQVEEAEKPLDLEDFLCAKVNAFSLEETQAFNKLLSVLEFAEDHIESAVEVARFLNISFELPEGKELNF